MTNTEVLRNHKTGYVAINNLYEERLARIDRDILANSPSVLAWTLVWAGLLSYVSAVVAAVFLLGKYQSGLINTVTGRLPGGGAVLVFLLIGAGSLLLRAAHECFINSNRPVFSTARAYQLRQAKLDCMREHVAALRTHTHTAAVYAAPCAETTGHSKPLLSNLPGGVAMHPRKKQGMLVDLFAGGGGASAGIKSATGRSPDLAVNHDEHAIRMHTANHPETEHDHASVWERKPDVACNGRAIDLL